MSGDVLRCGFVPLLDAAPLVVASALGFDREERIELRLERSMSWSTIRDKLAVGLIDCAHLLSPMPVASALGLGTPSAAVLAPFVLAVNGSVIGASAALSRWLDLGQGASSMAALSDRIRAAQAGAPIRVGAPWRHSMHALLMRRWLRPAGFSAAALDFRIIPPQAMPEALRAGEIDLFCVGEPWGSAAAEATGAALLASTAAIWRFAPEKVLGVRASLEAARPDLVDALLRALHRAARWASAAEHRPALAELLARAEYVDAPAERLERALSSRLEVACDTFGGAPALEFSASLANFPWASQERWIAEALRAAAGEKLDGLAPPTFRPDIYRRALGPLGAPLPLASAKVEGALAAAAEFAGVQGAVTLGPDAFFDGEKFDLAQLAT